MFSKSQKYYYDRSAMLSPTGANIHSVWKVSGKPFTGAHFATFPTELIEPIVLASSPIDGIVLDPFAGSGTVGLLCRQYKRHFLLCDVSQQNVELAQQRVACGITKDDKTRLGIEPVKANRPKSKTRVSSPKSKLTELLPL